MTTNQKTGIIWAVFIMIFAWSVHFWNVSTPPSPMLSPEEMRNEAYYRCVAFRSGDDARGGIDDCNKIK